MWLQGCGGALLSTNSHANYWWRPCFGSKTHPEYTRGSHSTEPVIHKQGCLPTKSISAFTDYLKMMFGGGGVNRRQRQRRLQEVVSTAQTPVPVWTPSVRLGLLKYSLTTSRNVFHLNLEDVNLAMSHRGPVWLVRRKDGTKWWRDW